MEYPLRETDAHETWLHLDKKSWLVAATDAVNAHKRTHGGSTLCSDAQEQGAIRKNSHASTFAGEIVALQQCICGVIPNEGDLIMKEALRERG